ncbi:MAG: hydroxyethylthiazole kinase [Peptococcaceae bacterium]|nr:hydroxyethylthiazole kinase [Peptococcaceae bacterium]
MDGPGEIGAKRGLDVQWNRQAAEILDRVRGERPLVHHITNLVVTNLTANVIK